MNIGDWNFNPFSSLLDGIKKEIKIDRDKCKVFPKSDLVFNAFKLCPLADLKVVIIKQSTYADDFNNGLAFSQSAYADANESSNRFVDAMDKQFYEYGSFPFPENDLTYLAKQGVLLLNRELTISELRKHEFWIPFTNEVIKLIQEQNPNVFFIIFGATDLEPMMKNNYWLFKTMKEYEQSDCFVKINELLEKPIQWI
jgi:uracil-DNA glycosylase